MQPFFLDGPLGPLFVNFFDADSAPRSAAYLFVPPFAEELNRSRHLMAGLARQAAAAGFPVLLLDLYGTGDSGGRYENGNLARWQDDIAVAVAWLKRQGFKNIGMVALRTGALLAAGFKDISHLILWSPVISGDPFLTQFLRIRVAEAMARDAAAKESTKDLKARLLSGETLEVGGYALTPAMAAALGEASLTADTPRVPVHWFEMGASISPAAEKAAALWRGKGVPVQQTAIPGPMFWSLLEPEPTPGLLTATVDAMRERAAA